MNSRESLQNHPEQRANSARKTTGVTSWPLRAALALLVLSALAHPRPGHSQTESASASESSSNTLILPGSMPSEEAYQELLTQQLAPKCSEFIGEASLSCYEFTKNTGEKGMLDTIHGTTGILPDGRTGINDITEYYLNGELKDKLQANGKKFLALASDINQITTIRKFYNGKNNTFYFLDGYRQDSRNQLDIPLVILMIPVDTLNDQNTQRLMQIILPSETPENYVKLFDLSAEGNYIKLNTNKSNIEIYIDGIGNETGKVEIKPISYKVGIPAVFNQFIPRITGVLTGWLGRYLH